MDIQAAKEFLECRSVDIITLAQQQILQIKEKQKAKYIKHLKITSKMSAQLK